MSLNVKIALGEKKKKRDVVLWIRELEKFPRVEDINFRPGELTFIGEVPFSMPDHERSCSTVLRPLHCYDNLIVLFLTHDVRLCSSLEFV